MSRLEEFIRIKTPGGITPPPKPEGLASYIDHTLLKPTATREDIKRLCMEAIQYNFKTVCVNPFWVSEAKKLLYNTPVGICSVVGFPLGATLPEVKAQEARAAVREGATEIDMVMNIGALKEGSYNTVVEDIKAVLKALPPLVTLKVIIETAYLTEEEKVKAALLVEEACAHFVKTSTGFAGGGATVEDIKLLKKVVGDKLLIKASGGVQTQEQALALIEAGADRIGASRSVNIIGKSDTHTVQQDNY